MDADSEQLLKERFLALPKIVQDAISSAKISEHMKKLADKHKLHVDQWQLLENEVLFTILGLQPAPDLAKSIQNHVGLSEEASILLANDIFELVFDPIRKEMVQELAAQEKPKEGVVVQDLTAEIQGTTPITEPPKPTKIIEYKRTPEYNPGEPSHVRTSVDGDPYREQILP